MLIWRGFVLSVACHSACILGLAGPAHGQSLADMAAAENKRRATVKQPAKTHTNKDLAPVAPDVPVAVPGESDKPSAASATPTLGMTDEEVKAKPKVWWQARMETLRLR